MKTRFFYGDPSPPMPNRPLGVGVTAIVLHPEDGRVLLERRSDNGRWATLGGGVEPGEHSEDTVVREVREETGLEVIRTHLVGVLANRSMVIAYPDGNVVGQICLTYLVEVATPAIPKPSNEALELGFFTLEEALGLDLITLAQYQLERLRAKDVPFAG